MIRTVGGFDQDVLKLMKVGGNRVYVALERRITEYGELA